MRTNQELEQEIKIIRQDLEFQKQLIAQLVKAVETITDIIERPR